MSAYLPTLFDPADVAREYKPRTQEFMDLGRKAGLRPAHKDTVRGALVIIDMQNDFVRPAPVGALSVPNAEADVDRLIRFIYKNAEDITAIFATLDTHYPLQIFFSEWWEDPETHLNPPDGTIITAQDILRGKWRATIDPVWSHYYVAELDKRKKKALMIWPKHTMFGTPGHNIVPALYEAIMWHTAARSYSQPTMLTKGDVPQVERYGVFGPEIPYAKSARGGTDTAVLDTIGRYHRTWLAGEAETHCVLESQVQYTSYFQGQPDVLKRTFFLMDCTSPIVIPGGPDFVGMARAEQARMASMGVQLVKSTDAF